MNPSRPEEPGTLSPDERRRFEACQPLKRNNHDPRVLSYIFSEILNQEVVFWLEMDAGGVLRCYAKMACHPNSGDFSARWALLRKAFIPVVYPVILLFEYPYAVLDVRGCLEAVQLA
jgi:hypothetical protein